MMVEWGRVPTGVTVRGADNYEWVVTEIEPDGHNVRVTIKRIDGVRELQVVMGRSKLVEVTSVPTEHQGRRAEDDPEFGPALLALQRSLGPLQTVSCPWCNYEDNDAPCACMGHCGSVRCVNFRDPLSLVDLGIETG